MDIIKEVTAELERAMKKFPTWPTDPLHALAVIGEEYGELNKEVLQLTYEPHKTSPEKVRSEAIQTAAMSIRFLMSLDHYHYRPTLQHSQVAEPRQVHQASEGDRFIGMTADEISDQLQREI